MGENDKTYPFILIGFCSLLMVLGCATGGSYRINPVFESRSQEIKTAGLLSPDIKVYELTAGGVRELKDEWCAKGRENVQGALIECLRKKPLEIRPIVVEKQFEEEMEEIYALYRAVNFSILSHTYGNLTFPEKMKNFDYSIGSIEEISRTYGAEALIFVYGSDEISTAGRLAAQALGVFAGALVGAFTGVMVVPAPRSGMTALSVAVVDPSGTILWYNMKQSGGYYDLRKPESATGLVMDLLTGYPEKKK
jgi:hypothetical protein